MTTRLATPLLAVATALGLLTLSACGGGSSTPASVPADADVVVKAEEGIQWNEKSYTATATDGKVTIFGENDSALAHNLYVLDSNDKVVGDYIDLPTQGLQRHPPAAAHPWHLSHRVQGARPQQHEQRTRRQLTRHADSRSVGLSRRVLQALRPVDRLGTDALLVELGPLTGQFPCRVSTLGVRISVAMRSAEVACQRGLEPSVPTATTTGPRRVTAGRMNQQFAGSSALFTHMPLARASVATWALTAGSSVAVITSWWPSRSAAT